MKNLLFKIQAFRRKNDIDVIKSEKESLKTIVIDTLSHKYALSRVQRSQVLMEIVEEWKRLESANENDKKLAHLEAEESKDISNRITLFNLVKN